MNWYEALTEAIENYVRKMRPDENIISFGSWSEEVSIDYGYSCCGGESVSAEVSVPYKIKTTRKDGRSENRIYTYYGKLEEFIDVLRSEA